MGRRRAGGDVKQPNPAGALIPLNVGREIALPDNLAAQAEDLARASLAPRTIQRYATCWRRFAAWCEAHGRVALPASNETLIGYATWLFQGQDDGRALANSTIAQAMAALQTVHRAKGYQIDWKTGDIKRVLQGIRRTIASKRSIRRVKALSDDDIRDMMEILDHEQVKDARDLALIATQFAGGRRRSEHTGLDWQELAADAPARVKRGEGVGILTSEPRGLVIKLMTSKTNTEGAEEEYLIAREHAGRCCAALDNWIRLAGIERATPVFRQLHKFSQTKGPQSGYPGVTWRKQRKCWQAHHFVAGRMKYLGEFPNEEEAYAKRCAVKGEAPQPKWHNAVRPGRLKDRDVALIIRSRMLQVLIWRATDGGKKRLRADDRVALVAESKLYSGHSPRAGLVTSAHERGIPWEETKKITGHRSDAMRSVYTRLTDMAKHSPMRGSSL